MGAITVTNLGKAYKQYPTRWSRLFEWVIPFIKPRHHLKWVLQDINFSVSPGEAMGIIGINGAGKSTLLKMITGTTQPTTGKVQITGKRVAALLELGMGFHPDFTGRQNVFMSGQLLGYTVNDLTQLMPEIEQFAEIGEYIDQPVRVYSSGMQMRLAFSVATAVRPDILIVDEALSVGDAYFQHKSIDRIRDYRQQGTTLLIVSHDKLAIQTMCDRAILLDAGHVAKEGNPEEIMDFYNALLADRENENVQQQKTEDARIQTTSGTGEAVIKDIKLFNETNEIIDTVDVGEQVCLSIQVEAKEDIPELVLGYMIKDRLGQSIYGTNTHHLKNHHENVKKGQLITYQFKFDANLGKGSYSIAVALHSSSTHIQKNYEWRNLALVFNVVNLNKSSFVGMSWLPPKTEIIYED
ncbi:MAG: ABC transporter ATP-binding protein [Methylococcales bacterium]|nr:ABC transporter ATP-binding protein [Methylococcales bacterium]